MPAPSLPRRRLLARLALTAASIGVAGCSGTAPDDDSSGTDAASAGTGAGPTEQRDEERDPSTEAAPTANETPATPTDGSAATTSTRDTASSTTDEVETMASDDELDLREANVVGVEFQESNGSYRFSVTLYHDDDGEDGYADWWQVETSSGEQLGRRTLLHAHSTAPFTRSETIAVPADTTYVVVRGHDQTHGYGGQAMVVNVETGESEAVRQGPEPRDFSNFEPSV